MSNGARFHPWLLDVVGCPSCGARLDTDPRGVLRCGGCSCLYPVLAGIAVLVPGPDRWVASYRESILAALAEVGAVGDEVLEMVSIFAGAAGRAEPRRWNDDWVASEEWDEPWPEVPEEHAESFGAFAQAARDGDPNRRLPAELERADVCIELGVGAGAMAVELAPRVDRLIIADLSLRALITAHTRCAEAGATEVCAAVIDGDHMRLLPNSVDAVVAANLIDLLEYPDEFLAAAAEGLRAGGALALTTPEPSLGDPEADDILDELCAAHGLQIHWSEAHLPWLRPHRSREWQVYFVRALLARREA